MTKCAPAWRLFQCLTLIFVAFTGCSQFKRAGIDDERDPHYIEGKRRMGGMDWDGAIESFERALQSNPNNAEAHRELGLLFYERKNDYTAAIYHLQRYLKLKPNASLAEQIKLQIDYSKREIARTHALVPVDRSAQSHLERLTMTNDLLRRRIEFLEAQLARGPQYITNFVTNFVKLPEFERGTSRILTQPAEVVEAPPQRPEQESAEEPPPPLPRAPVVAQAPRNSGPSPRSGPQVNNGASDRTAQSTSGTTQRTHRVRPGETMAVLARRYGVSVAELKAANPGTANGVRAGQTIKIPAK